MKRLLNVIGVTGFIILLILNLTGTVFAADDGIVSFNKATAEEIMAIEGIDIPKELAKAIVEYREKNGPYRTSSDLQKVPGMTQDFLEELNPQEKDGDVFYDPDALPALAPSKC